MVIDVRLEAQVQFRRLTVGAKRVVVYLLPAALRINAFNVAIPRLTCSDAQRPGWLEVYFGDDISCLLYPTSIMLQPLS